MNLRVSHGCPGELGERRNIVVVRGEASIPQITKIRREIKKSSRKT